MINREKRNNYLLSQALAYLSSGVFLIISYDLHDNTILNYIGYLLLSISIVILVSILVSELVPDIKESFGRVRKRILLCLKNLKRRVAITLDVIGSGVLPIISIMALILAIIEKNKVSYNLPLDNSVNVVNLNLTNVLIIVISVFILYGLVQLAELLRRNLKLGLYALACILILIYISKFVPSIFNLVFITIMVIVFISLAIIRIRQERIRNKRKYVLPLYRIFILLSLVFFIAGVLSNLTGSFEMSEYFGLSIFLLYGASALLLWAPTWRKHLPLAVKIRFILLFLLGGALFVIITLFHINVYLILGVSLVGIISFFLPEIVVLFKHST